MPKVVAKAAKTRGDILEIISKMIEQNGGPEMTFYLVRVEQHTGKKLYAGSLPNSFLHAMVCRLPRDMNNPEGIQRALKSKNLEDIKALHLCGKCDTPNGISLTLDINSPFLTFAPLNQHIYALTVHLQEYYDHIARQEVDEEDYLRYPEKAMLGFLIDGHHRTEGAYLAGNMEYEFVSGIYLDCQRREIATYFVGINGTQEKPSAVHICSVQELAGILNDREKSAAALMRMMNEEFPLFMDRIRMYDGPRGKGAPRYYINNNKMMSLLEEWSDNEFHAGFGYNDIEVRYRLLQNYFQAWKTCYEEAWDNAKFVLTKAMGITLMFAAYIPLANLVKDRRTNNSLPSEKDFVEAIHDSLFLKEEGRYLPINIEVGEDSLVPLDWNSEVFGQMSSGKGINLLKHRLQDQISTYRSRSLSTR